jgi:D-alanyl-D-alanine carboxypeptidase/Putative peptidoglycan binding domain
MEYTYKLSYGDVGADIRRLQEFLISKSASLSPDGHFGPKTRDAVTAWQHDHGLNQTGVVDKVTRESLQVNGFIVRTPPSASAQTGTNWPAKPASPPQPNPKLTESLFGRFNFVPAPTPDNPEHIEIQDNWVENNIATINIPELDNCLFAEGNTYAVRPVGRIQCHKLAAPKFVQLFAQWHAAGLIDRVITCAGAFSPRLIRGSTTASRANLSNHAWGTALDINDEQNPRKHVPVALDARGCIRELVDIANSLGFFWGGHFRPFDGMHFELAEL